MTALILKVVLTVAVFLTVLTTMGGGFGTLELFVWLALQIAVISFFFVSYKKNRSNSGAHTP